MVRRLMLRAELAGEDFAAALFMSLAGLNLSLWLISKGALISLAASPLM